jgi:hypothetical protein
MSVSPSLNAAGRCRSPATLPGYLAGRPPRDKGLRYPADPPTVEKIVAAIRQAGGGAHVARLRALIVLAYRAAHPGGADADRARPRAARRVGARAPRQGRPAPRGRHGPVGLGTAPPSAHAADGDAGRSAAVRDRRADPWAAPGQATPPARNCAASPPSSWFAGAPVARGARTSDPRPVGVNPARVVTVSVVTTQVEGRAGGAFASARRRRAAAPSEARWSSLSLAWLAARPP